MTRRHYGQACSLAGALDRIGERWSLLIVRELLLGPLRFSDLDRAVGGAPTDVLTKRLRDLEREGIVARRELDPPASAVAYELTELGRGLERPILELARWGLNFFQIDDVDELEASWLPNSLRVVLQPPPDAEMTVQLRSRGNSFRLQVADGWIAAERGEAADADLTLAGEPRAIISALVLGDEDGDDVTVEGDLAALAALRAMVVLPERLQDEALDEAATTARTA
ncbi:MAG TPA: helix-turn-helix domain-containing protein [Solirubrobacterales bacterium]|nr:helix-turn-helix domain-containing protein [Solirubrobacterales bacterium]